MVGEVIVVRGKTNETNIHYPVERNKKAHL
jgi:hypothetical protein